MKRAIKRHTEEEEAAIEAGIAADPETRPWSDEEFAQAVPARQVSTLSDIRRKAVIGEG